MTRITVAMIRAKYPHPRRSGDEGSGYCVGGACCLFVSPKMYDFTDPHSSVRIFPTKSAIRFALRRCNTQLSVGLADHYTALITEHNDVGDFETAWQTLEAALTHAVEGHSNERRFLQV